MTRKRRSLNALNAADHRGQPKMIAKLLNDALATGDTSAFVTAMATKPVLRA
jgi:DNA-binding phage protein